MTIHKPERVANKDCRSYVQKRHAFEGSNLFSNHRVVGTYPTDSQHYTVYSYGHHFPLFIYADGIWFENEDKYSRTTSKHRSQAHPHPTTNTVKLSTEAMWFLDDYGIYKFTAKYKLGVAA